MIHYRIGDFYVYGPVTGLRNERVIRQENCYG